MSENNADLSRKFSPEEWTLIESAPFLAGLSVTLSDLRSGLFGAIKESFAPSQAILEAGAEFFMTVSDDAAVEAVRLLHRGVLSGGSIIAGESGAAGLAGLLAVTHDSVREGLAHLRLNASSRVLLIGTEGATDPEIYEGLVRA